MTIGVDLPCPSCARPLGSLAWHDADGGECRHCRTPFEFMGFPALGATRAGVAPKSALIAEHATCFHHPENQAEVVCEGCGRFLCSVCAINYDGRQLCPTCVKAAIQTDDRSTKTRTLYGRIALSLAIGSLIFWPLGLIGAPASLVLVFVGWHKPQSVVQPGRGRMIAAAVIASLEVAGWIILFLYLWLKRKH